MLSGATEHEDFAGHRGVIHAGDLQWMTAGRGIVHCEMPHGKEVSSITCRISHKFVFWFIYNNCRHLYMCAKG